MNFFDSTLIYPIFDVESIGDGPRVPRAHLEVVLTQLLAARARPLYPAPTWADMTITTGEQRYKRCIHP